MYDFAVQSSPIRKFLRINLFYCFIKEREKNFFKKKKALLSWKNWLLVHSSENNRDDCKSSMKEKAIETNNNDVPHATLKQSTNESIDSFI
jgi:hypothetical protein